MLGEIREPVQYVIVNEAGASVYSASKLATEEFPDFDVAQRAQYPSRGVFRILWRSW